MSDIRDAVRKYDEKMHATHLGFTVDTLPPKLMQFCRKLYDEEAKEVTQAWDAFAYYDSVRNALGPDPVKPDERDETIGHLLHELGDVVLTAFITADHLGVNFDDVLNAIMRANMRKVPPTVEGGKATKPEGWQAADAVIVELVKASRRAADSFAAAERMGRPNRAAGTYGPAFSANFDGVCPECDDDIEPGESIRMGDDGAVHSQCVGIAS